jgi:hypothetical protein
MGFETASKEDMKENSPKSGKMNVLWIGTMQEADERDRRYWQSRTPRQRMQALEELRQMNYGYGKGKPEPKFQRVLKIAELGQG